MATTLEDRQIVTLFWQRSQDAVPKLYEKYGRLARTVASNILHSDQDVEECINDSCFALWNNIPPKKPDALGAFFVAVTRNLACKKLRYNTRQKRCADVADFDELADLIGDSDADPRTIDGAGRVIDRFLERLPRVQRVLFMRRYYFGESVASAAKAVGITENHAGVLLSRIRRKLKNALSEEGVEV